MFSRYWLGMRVVIPLALIWGGSACTVTSTGPVQTVRVTVDRAVYYPGDTVTMGIVNVSTDTLGFTPCVDSLEQATATGDWTPVVIPTDGCFEGLLRMLPGDSATVRYSLPGTLALGSYRFVLPKPPRLIDNETVAPETGRVASVVFTVSN